MLAISRIMVAWQPVGLAMGVYDMCARYVRERRQFGAPLGAFQLVQERLARMQGDVQAMFLMAWRLSVLQEQARSPRVCCLYHRVNLLAGKCMWQSASTKKRFSSHQQPCVPRRSPMRADRCCQAFAARGAWPRSTTSTRIQPEWRAGKDVS